MRAAAVPATPATHAATVTLDGAFPISRAALAAIVLVVVLALGAGLRTADLSIYGFSADEINRVNAIQEYRKGHFVVNAEHPMLMKLAMWASVEVSESWNHFTRGASPIAMEAAVRLPNALAGAATALVLFAICDMLFGTAVGLMVSIFWAFDVNAIAISRLGKTVRRVPVGKLYNPIQGSIGFVISSTRP